MTQLEAPESVDDETSTLEWVLLVLALKEGPGQAVEPHK